MKSKKILIIIFSIVIFSLSMLSINNVVYAQSEENLDNSSKSIKNYLTDFKQYKYNKTNKTEFDLNNIEDETLFYEYMMNLNNKQKTFRLTSNNDETEIKNIAAYLGAGWSKKNNSYIDVASNPNTKSNPIEIGLLDPGAPFNSSEISIGLRNNNIDNYGGCGAKALINQLLFLTEVKKYSSLIKNQKKYDINDPLYQKMKEISYKSRIDFLTELYANISVFVKNKESVLTFPHKFNDALNYFLKKAGLSDFISTYRSRYYNIGYSDKINAINNSIERGMPVIVWTSNNGGYLNNHYFNVYGKEIWKNSKGVEKTFYLVRANWARPYTIYLDADSLNGFPNFWGYITVIENFSHKKIETNDYDYSQRYYNYEKEEFISANDLQIKTKRYRTGRINTKGFNYVSDKYDWFITMSGVNETQNHAYIEYELPKNIKGISFDISSWDSFNSFNSNNCNFTFDIYLDGKWKTIYNFIGKKLSEEKYDPSTFAYKGEIAKFRFKIETLNYIHVTNGARIIIGDINLFY